MIVEEICPIVYFGDGNTINAFGDRIGFIKREFVRQEDIKKRDLKHPTYIRLFDFWDKYISLPEEDYTMYEQLKKMFIEVFGQPVFQAWLDYSYVFHQTQYMKKKNLFDIYNYIDRL